MLKAAILAVPLTLVLLRVYRRAVLSAMRRRVGASPVAVDASVPFAVGSPGEAPSATELVERDPRTELSAEEARLVHDAQRGPWLTALVYGLGGLAAALTFTAIWFPATDTEFNLRRALYVVYVHAWPIVLTTFLVAASSRRGLATLVAIFLAVLALVGWGVWRDAALGWVLFNGQPTAYLLALLQPAWSAIGPLVLAFVMVAYYGQYLTWGGFYYAWVNGINVLGAYFEVAELWLPLFGVLGWLALGRIRGWYERKQISDQWLLVDAVWVVFALDAGIDLSNEALGWGILAGALGFIAYRVTTVGAFRLLNRTYRDRPSYRLLFLRVFGSRKRSERLLGVLGARWRYVGSIQMIAGTDLATRTVQPHQFLDFLSGTLANRYIDGAERLGRRIDELDLRPDQDGRFRVNEFLCYDDTWRMTLARLVAESDAVLMDLREFTTANQGCTFELNALVNLVPLTKVVLIVDDTTDVGALRRVLDQTWASMSPISPNHQLANPQVTTCRLKGDDARQIPVVLANLARASVAGRDLPPPRVAPYPGEGPAPTRDEVVAPTDAVVHRV